MDSFGQRIRETRFGKEIRVKDLAEAAGISEQSLLAIENGRVENPGFKTVARIAAGLGLSLDELHSGRPGLSAEEWRVLDQNAETLRGLYAVLGAIVPKLEEG